MGYTALYRKLRPQRFDEIVSQVHIVKTLKSQIETGRVTHAYLFCGTRGTGKTTMAKLFAKAVNCKTPEDGEPCEKCESCKSISENRSMEVVEIDAASNNGVDNIRDLREAVKYPPTVGKYKVYIIDEVHMLSTGAFNALLKTLEEPPAHVIFILATTDPQKIPATIHSRCQRFDFKRIKPLEMAEALRKYSNEENVSITDEALGYISAVSDGAMRDAISILDQCISFFYGEDIDVDKVLEITGSVDKKVFFTFASLLSEQNSESLLELIDKIVFDGRDISQFITEFVSHLRNLLVSVTAPKSEVAVNASADAKAEYLEQGKSIGVKKVMDYIRSFSSLQNEIKYSANERILLEIACLKICNEVSVKDEDVAVEAISARLDKIERDIKSRPAQAVSSNILNAEKKKDNIQAGQVKEEKTVPKAVPEDILRVIKEWKKLSSTFPALEGNIMLVSFPGYLNDNRLTIACGNVGHTSVLNRKRSEIEEKLEKTYNRKFDVVVMNKSMYDESHKRLYGKDDDFEYNDIDIIKNDLNCEVIIDEE